MSRNDGKVQFGTGVASAVRSGPFRMLEEVSGRMGVESNGGGSYVQRKATFLACARGHRDPECSVDRQTGEDLPCPERGQLQAEEQT